MLGSTLISIPRADWQGTLAQFVTENTPFMPDYEMERLIKGLKEDGYSSHKPINSNEFGILIVKDNEVAAA